MSSTLMLASTITVASLPKPDAKEMQGDPFIKDYVGPKTFSLETFAHTAWQHQSLRDTRKIVKPVTGYNVLPILLGAYIVGRDTPGEIYQAHTSDWIQHCYDLPVLIWLRDNWKALPEEAREWIDGNVLCACGIRRSANELIMPCLGMVGNKPVIRWLPMNYALTPQMYFLHD